MGHRGSCCELCHRVFCLFSSKSFIVSGLTFGSLIHFEFIFLYGVRKYSGEGNGTPLQYSCLENPMDGGAWWGRKESDTAEQLHFHVLEKEMATHSNVFAWRIPGTGEPGGLLSMGSHRVGHN